MPSVGKPLSVFTALYRGTIGGGHSSHGNDPRLIASACPVGTIIRSKQRMMRGTAQRDRATRPAPRLRGFQGLRKLDKSFSEPTQFFVKQRPIDHHAPFHQKRLDDRGNASNSLCEYPGNFHFGSILPIDDPQQKVDTNPRSIPGKLHVLDGLSLEALKSPAHSQ
jgi:hypothetical protein